MQSYLNHLISDLQQAAENQPVTPVYFNNTADWIPEHVLEWEQAPAQKMSEIFGIEKEIFPPAEMLTDEQLIQVVEAFIALWNAYRYEPFFPYDLPYKTQYKILLKYLGEEAQYISEKGGSAIFFFCELDTENCIFGEGFCDCKEHEAKWAQDAEDMKNGKYDGNSDDLPF